MLSEEIISNQGTEFDGDLFSEHRQVKKSFGQSHTSLSPMLNRDTGRHTLLQGIISRCKRVGERMSTIVTREAKVLRQSMGVVFLSTEVQRAIAQAVKDVC